MTMQKERAQLHATQTAVNHLCY